MPRIKRLNRLLPMRFPTAMSTSPSRTALRSTDSSGKEVAPANKMLPTSNRPRPVRSAMASAYLVRYVPAITITAAETTNCRMVKLMFSTANVMVPYAMTEEESRNRELLGCPPRHDPCAEQLCQLGGRHGHQGQRQDVKPVTAGMGRYVEHRASQRQRDHGDLEQRRYCDRPEQGEVGERSQPPERFGLTTASEGEEQLRERQCAECGGTCATEVFTLAEGIGEGYNPHGCHQNAMEKDPQPTAVGDHRLMRRARPAAHDVAFERLNTQGKSWQAVGHEVDPEKLDGSQWGGPAE